MEGSMTAASPGEPAAASPRRRRRGVTVISRQKERCLYFAATVVFATWYLLARLF